MQCTTAKTFCQSGQDVTAAFARERLEIGFQYFPNFSIARQIIQDEILEQFWKKIPLDPPVRPTAIFMLGAPGSGKSTEAARIPTQVLIDADYFKIRLPEFNTFPKFLASGVVHKEATLLAALSQRRAEHLGINVVVDGACANADWLDRECTRLRERGYRLEMVHTVLSRTKCINRCAARSRHVPKFVIDKLYCDADATFRLLNNKFDHVREINTD